jgi:hypothetical protein
VLTNALLKRTQDPNAISILSKHKKRGADKKTPTGADTNLAVMHACLSTIIDLHSTDHIAYIEVTTLLADVLTSVD